MSAAFDSDVDITISLGFGSGPLAASPSWSDVSTYGRSVSIRRGRSSVDSAFGAGTAVVMLDNRDGRFDPNDTGSPYSPNVQIGTPIRIQAVYNLTTYTLFRGFVERWPLAYPANGKDAVATLECSDNWTLLAGSLVGTNGFVAGTSDVRIDDVLDDANWPAADRDLDTGILTFSAFAASDTETASTHLRKVEVGEQGTVFVAGDGKFTFHNRTHYSGVSSTATFGPANVNYTGITLAYDRDFFYNVASVIGASGNTQTASGSSSVSSYGAARYQTSNDLLSDVEALNVAEWVVDKHAAMTVRVSGITVTPQAQPSTAWPVVLGVELRDMVTVVVDPPGTNDDYNQTATVEAITHDFNTNKQWHTSLSLHPLSAAETADYWILGTSNDLDTDTVLA